MAKCKVPGKLPQVVYVPPKGKVKPTNVNKRDKKTIPAE
jgi:hypothetical protein